VGRFKPGLIQSSDEDDSRLTPRGYAIGFPLFKAARHWR